MSTTASPENNIAWHCIDRPARMYPGSTAVIVDDAQLMFSELRGLTHRAANAIVHAGCRFGDRVLLCLPDSADFVAAFCGAASVGAIAVPVDPFAPEADHQYYSSDSTPKVVVTHPSLAPRFSGATILTPEDISGFEPESECRAVEEDDIACFIYTSGSTGRQKAVMHPHRSFVRIIDNVVRAVLHIGHEDRLFSIARLPFSFGLGCGLYFPLPVGASSVLNPHKTDVAKAAQLIARHRPTILAGVPSFWDVLLEAAARWLPLDLSSVRLVISAGEPLPPRLHEAFRDRYGIEVVEGLGSTEMLHIISHRPGSSRAASCGYAVPGCELELRNDDGSLTATGEIGGLWARGDTAFRGYWNRPEQTARTIVDGWVSMGDKLSRDSDGFMHYCGRNDDMLKVAGMWVSPRDIESAMARCPGVARVAVTTREDERGRRRVVAYVTPSAGAALQEADLWKYAGEHLQIHMLPSGFRIVSALPLTSNGKLNRPALPEPLWKQPEATSK